MACALSYKRIGVNKKNSNLSEQQFLSTEKEVFKAIPEKTAGLNIVQVKGEIVQALIERIEIGESRTDENGVRHQQIDIFYKFIGKVDF